MSNLNKLNKEDRKHVDILYQLKRTDALLATILYQLNQIAPDTSDESHKVLNAFKEKNKQDMENVINRLLK